jgi:hypothetical protein
VFRGLNPTPEMFQQQASFNNEHQNGDSLDSREIEV